MGKENSANAEKKSHTERMECVLTLYSDTKSHLIQEITQNLQKCGQRIKILSQENMKFNLAQRLLKTSR